MATKMRKIKPKIMNRYETKPVEKKPEPKFPSVTLDLSVIPEAKDWEIGGKYVIAMEVTMTALKMRKSKKDTGMGMMDNYDYDNNATFDITGVDTEETDEANDESASDESDEEDSEEEDSNEE